MSKNDDRMQRGLAVARRMRGQQGNRIDFNRGMSELAWLGSQLTAADLQMISAADARGGLEAVRQALSGAGLTESGFAALEAQYRRGGLQTVGAAVQAQIQHETALSAQQEASMALEGLRPEQWRAAEQVLAAGGPEALYREAVALGMSPAAAAQAVQYVATSGVDQARQAVTQQAQERARQDAAYQAAQRDFEAAQRDPSAGALASQNVHQAALNYYAAHAAALEAAGVGAKQGESPVAWIRRIANAGEDITAKVAQATGTEQGTLARLFADTRQREAEVELVSRIRASDEAQRKARAMKPQYPEGDKPSRRNEDGKIREAIERASEALGLTDDERMPANSRLEMQMAAADEYLSGAEPGSTFYPAGSHGKKAAAELQTDVDRRLHPGPTRGVRGAIERASAYLEGRSQPSEDSRPAPERSESTGTRMSIDDAMRAADRHLNGGSDGE